MEAIIGGAIVGAAVVTLGRPLVSGLADVLSPVGDEVMKAGNAAYGAVAGTVAGAGAWVTGLVGAPGGDGEGVLEVVSGAPSHFCHTCVSVAGIHLPSVIPAVCGGYPFEREPR